jgi:phosphoribosylglycinamide formyltransferase-1
MQGAVAVRDDDTPETLAARVIDVEHRIYPLALKLVAEGRVEIIEGERCRITDAGGSERPLVSPDPV